jgi:Fur family ferric uptake transcriptional regulator
MRCSNLASAPCYGRLCIPERVWLHAELSQLQLYGSTLDNTELKKAGLKVTVPRLKILEILEKADPHHLSAEDVYRRLVESDESIGLATVYRVLTQFESAGLVARHNFDDGHAVYELASDEHHDHMVDLDSGRVLEFFDERIEKLQREIAEEHGFDLVDHTMVLYVKKKG